MGLFGEGEWTRKTQEKCMKINGDTWFEDLPMVKGERTGNIISYTTVVGNTVYNTRYRYV